MATFETINQPQAGGTPQFTQEAPVSDGIATTVSQVAAVGSSLFADAAKATNKARKTAAEEAESTALGGLQQKLLNIKQAGSTSNIDVTREQRKAMSQFNANYPALRVEGSKVFKAETGQGPAESSPEEAAEQKLSFEAIDAGFGRYGASDDFNAVQLELYVQTKRADKLNASAIQKNKLAKERGEISDGVFKAEVIASIQNMEKLSYTKILSDSRSWIADAAAGDEVAIERAQLSIRRARIDINSALGTLGEFATDDAVLAYIQPSLDELQLAEDVISGKIEGEAIAARIAINESRAKGIFFATAENVRIALISDIFRNLVGFDSVLANSGYDFFANGIQPEDMQGFKKKKLPDVQTLDADNKKGVRGVGNNILTSNDEGAKKEYADVLEGVAEHLSRNGMDYDSESKMFVVDLLGDKGAMELLNPVQTEAVMMGFELYLVDDATVNARKYVTNPPPVNVSMPFPRSMGGSGKGDIKQMVEIADMKVVDGRIFWTIKPKFASNGKVQNIIRTTNRHIQEEVTPVVNILSKGTGRTFESEAKRLVFEEDPDAEQTTNDGVPDLLRRRGDTPTKK